MPNRNDDDKMESGVGFGDPDNLNDEINALEEEERYATEQNGIQYDDDEEDEEIHQNQGSSSNKKLYMGLAAIFLVFVLAAGGYYFYQQHQYEQQQMQLAAQKKRAERLKAQEIKKQKAEQKTASTDSKPETDVLPATKPLAKATTADSVDDLLSGKVKTPVTDKTIENLKALDNPSLNGDPDPTSAPNAALVGSSDVVSMAAFKKDQDRQDKAWEHEAKKLKLQNTKLENQLNDMTRMLDTIQHNKGIDYSDSIGNTNKNLGDLAKTVGDMKGDIVAVEIEKLKAQLADLDKSHRLSKEDLAKLLDKRTRLKGFMVLSATNDGKMSIVKTPSQRINTYFKDETFFANGVRQKVTGIEDGGYLVLVGDKYFIDETYEAIPKTVAKKSTSTHRATKTVSSKSTTTTTTVDSTKYANGRLILSGWGKSGEYSRGYFVSDPKGNWYTVRIGETLKGVGQVVGEDLDGNLIVGDKVILNKPNY